MLTVENLTKRYGSQVAVNDLSFTVPDGAVTGFLGPNGSGKSTTMRLCVGLERPNSGTATFDGADFRSLENPAATVGTLLDATWFNPGRSARNHLGFMADLQGLPSSRVDEELARVGLTEVASKRVGNYSLGMKQRLGLACALLGRPQHVLLDEPVNGLDPSGVHWMRDRIREFAAEGRAVLVSSHLLSEMQLTADRLVVIGRGSLIGEGSLEDFLGSTQPGFDVVVDQPELLAVELHSRGYAVEKQEGGVLAITGLDDPATIGRICLEQGQVLSRLSPRAVSLEQAFLAATDGAVDYRAS